jgi:hypothetical protein
VVLRLVSDQVQNVKTTRRVKIIAVLVVTGAIAGWLTFNLGLDFLLGGRTFR